MRDFVNEVRYAARTLWGARVVSIATILTLGIGIGLLTAIFSLVNAAVLRPLPYDDARQLLALSEVQPRSYASYSWMSPAGFAVLRDRARTFAAVAAYRPTNPNVVTGSGDAKPSAGADVSTNMFALLRVAPFKGRVFTSDEGTNGANVVMVAHEFWMSRLGARDDAIGSTLRFDGVPHTIIGVMPPGFNFPQRQQLWRPLLTRVGDRDWLERSVSVVARLRSDVSIEGARAEVRAIGSSFAREHHPTEAGWSFILRDEAIERGAIPGPLPWMVLAAGTFLLLIACSNVATVLLARAAMRRPEMAVRAALGASRGRLVRQLLVETSLLAIGGGVAGVLLANWLLALAWALMPTENFPAWIDIGIDWRVLAFTAGVAFMALFAIGIGPALTATRVRLADPLKVGGSGDTASRRELRSSRALVIVEVAAAFVLFIGATLMLQNFRALQHVDFGIRAENVLVTRPWLSLSHYSDPVRREAYFAEALEAVRRIPGAEVVGLRGHLDSLRGAPWTNDSAFPRYRIVTPGAEPPLPASASLDIELLVVSPSYFDAVQLPLLRGRHLDDSDAAAASRVAVVSALVAERLWPNADAIGRQFRLGGSAELITVVGLAGDVRSIRSGARGARTHRHGTIYLSVRQATARSEEIVIRSSEPLALTAAVSRALRSVDPDQSVGRMERLSDAMDSGRESALWLGVVFVTIAAGALALASIGLYGVIAYSVTRRTREIGVRMALGASATLLRRTVMAQALGLTSIGLGFGLAGALVLVRLAGAFTASTTAVALLSYLIVIVVFVVFSALASAIPARRATRVDPLIALRTQ